MHNDFLTRFLLFLIFAAFSFPAKAAKRPIYDVLYIQSYTAQDTWSEEQTDGLIKGFKDNSLSVNLTVEYLDSRYWDAKRQEETIHRISRQAVEHNTNLIVVSNDEALYSLLTYGDSLLTQIPVVFFGVEFPDEELMNRHNNLTGIVDPHPYNILLETAKSIFPNRTNTVMLTDDTPLGEREAEAFRKHWADFSNKHKEHQLKTFNVNQDPFTDILWNTRLSDFAQKSITVIPYWGMYMNSIAKVSKAPTFTFSASALLNGAFCALAPDMYKEAHQAAGVASRILLGESASSIPFVTSDYELIFDYQQLKFFNVKRDRLPKKSIIINEPYMEKYGGLMIMLYILILGLLLFLVIRLVAANRRELRRRMHTQTKLLIQNRLVAQRNEFDHIFHSIRDAVITYDTDYRIHFVNSSTLQMLNIGEEINEKSIRDFEGQNAGVLLRLYNNGKEILVPLLEKVSKEGVSIQLPENSFIENAHTKNYFPVSGEIVPLYADGKQTGLVFTFRNISEVALQKHFFDLAIQESAIYPWQYNKATATFTFPPNYIEHIGAGNNTTIPREEMDENIHPNDIKRVSALFDATLDGRTSKTRLIFRQYNYNTKSYEWWEFRVSVFSGLTGDSPYSILGVCQSIQRYKSTEEELIAARDRALQADKLKTAFLANMSHEIRTPLNSIVGFSDLLKDYKAFSEEDIQLFIATINKNCELLLALISDILDLSRVESGTMDFKFSPFHLPAIMQEIYDSQRLAMSAGVKLIKSTPPNSNRTIITDAVRLKQVINNLINNASKFTTEGSITFGYTEEEEEYTSFFVEDTGAGISKEDLDKIFERFYKVDTFTQGAGLGLSITQTIVSRFNGTINVTSNLGKGTRFTVRIPNEIE